VRSGLKTGHVGHQEIAIGELVSVSGVEKGAIHRHNPFTAAQALGDVASPEPIEEEQRPSLYGFIV